jgi:ATP-dependent Clp protease, protease subunit
MIEVIAHHSGQPIERVRTDIDRDYFMTAEEARTYGIVDHVIRARRGLAVAPAQPVTR